ncbi:protein of unknown function [Arthrobacter sp. ov407]|uniref:DUF4386 domain-containing protein n=1 Tax=Arthrobacter sp. ov407 TaxID=1761748 RepID=UPI00088F459C|nr:DUF4386 domain-containing protein [Arthrobacter sp. ov407]SDK94057.1 protein of unknown function [Arthrobacter sp. ov407]
MKSTNGVFSERALEVAPASPKRLARIAGIFYLVVGIAGGFSEGFVDPFLYVAGDAAATSTNASAHELLMRVGVITHLTDAVFFPLTAVTLYLLLKHVGKHAARLMVVPVVIAAGIVSISAVFTFAAMLVATDSSYETAFGPGGSSALVLLLLEIQHFTVLAAQVFFGLWLAPLGYLAYKSGLFPKALGAMLILAAASYLADVVVAFLLPGLAAQIHGYLGIVPAIAEIWMVLYLLTVGVRSARPAHQTPAVESAPSPSQGAMTGPK